LGDVMLYGLYCTSKNIRAAFKNKAAKQSCILWNSDYSC